MDSSILVLRHAECLQNKEQFISCSLDSPLSDMGRQQALNKKTEFKNFKPEKIITTSAIRTQSTAEIIFGVTAAIQTDDRLLEINAGDYNCKTWGDYFNSFPNEESKNFHERSPFPGGENYLDVINRASLFWKDLDLFKLKNMAIIAHGGSVGALLLCALQIESTHQHLYGAFEIKNCEGYWLKFSHRSPLPNIVWIGIQNKND